MSYSTIPIGDGEEKGSHHSECGLLSITSHSRHLGTHSLFKSTVKATYGTTLLRIKGNAPAQLFNHSSRISFPSHIAKTSMNQPVPWSAHPKRRSGPPQKKRVQPWKSLSMGRLKPLSQKTYLTVKATRLSYGTRLVTRTGRLD